MSDDDYAKKINRMNSQELMDELRMVIYKLSEGNIGAVNVLTQMVETVYEKSSKNSSLAGMGGEFMGNVFAFIEAMKITGPMLWLAYKDVCGEDIEKLLEKISDRTIVDDLENLKYGGYKRP